MATTKMQIVNNGGSEVKQKRGAAASSSPMIDNWAISQIDSFIRQEQPNH